MNIYHDLDIKKYSYIHVGGIVKNAIFAYNEKELIGAYSLKNVLVVGNTSKILFAFDYFNKTIVFDRNKYIIELNNRIVIGSGTPLAYIGKYFQDKGYASFSKIRTIPGRLGGSICQNASCFNQCISDNLYSVTFIENGKVMTKLKKELWFSYRNSYFKVHNCLILHCTFLKIEKEKELLKNEYINALEKRKLQPENEVNLGSIFKNKAKYQVAKILDSLNLKGYKLTKGVSLSKTHPNFLDIKKECTYQEILLLINTLYIVLYKVVGVIFPLEIIIIKGGD